MPSNAEKVYDFFHAFGHLAPDLPGLPDSDELRLRWSLICEEMEELEEEVNYALDDGDPLVVPQLVKEACDLLYVTYGFLLSLGVDPDLAFAEVHRSNMSKLWEDGRPRYRADGKVLKSPDYSPADIEALLNGASA